MLLVIEALLIIFFVIPIIALLLIGAASIIRMQINEREGNGNDQASELYA
jgi:hypothetical protein